MKKALKHSLLFLLKKLNYSGLRKDNKIHILFRFHGGFGDYLRIANYIDYFKKNFDTENITIFILAENKTYIEEIYNYEIINLNIIPQAENEYDFNDSYDLIFKCSKHIDLIYYNKKLETLSCKLFKYIKICDNYKNRNNLILMADPQLDGITTLKSEIKNINWLKEIDIDNFFNISIDYAFKILIKGNENEFLKDNNLCRNKYILIHRGWDKKTTDERKSNFNVKSWSLESCKDLIPKIKENFSNYKVVVFGKYRSQAPNPIYADLDLLENTTLDQVKILLKNAALLIDNEGGMVHLRHALHGGPSVILFGPTSKTVYGYPENENISSNICPVWCEWMSIDWPVKCIRTGEQNNPCMEAITTNDILNAVFKILNKNKIQ